MVGIYISVWVRKSLLVHVRGVQVTSIGTGFAGYLGNKGKSRSEGSGVAVRAKARAKASANLYL